MRKLILLTIIILLSCKTETKKNIQTKNIQTIKKTESKIETLEVELEYKIDFDSTKISIFTVEESQFSSAKALHPLKLSDYSTKELLDLPKFIRLTMSIVVPFDISKENLENTLKSIVYKKTEKNKDIDEIVIFAYDDKTDIGLGYTFGKLLWASNGKKGIVTAGIAKNNIRTNYSFDITIKNKVGNIKKSELPTKRELKIYDEMINKNGQYTGNSEDEVRKILMKKYKIKTKKEYEKLHLKVAVYKFF